MSTKLEQLRQDIEHHKRLLAATDRAAEGSKNHESLMMIFVVQAERIEDEISKLEAELSKLKKSEKASKSLKGKKNEKASKKHTKRR
jgi:hypothetical protein